MAAITKRLPVRWIPEQGGIAAMRFDMVHYLCGFDLAEFEAGKTERVREEIDCPCPSPAAIIAPHGRIRPSITAGQGRRHPYFIGPIDWG